jgi:hypothetical protein
MAGLRIATLVTVVALLGLIPGVAQAQNAPRMIDLTFKGYFSTLSGTNSAGTVFARGNAPMFGGAFNVYNPQNGIGWGAEYTTGGLSNGEGIWLNLQSSSTRWAQDRAGGLTGCSDCRFDWSGTYVQATWHR